MAFSSHPAGHLPQKGQVRQGSMLVLISRAGADIANFLGPQIQAP